MDAVVTLIRDAYTKDWSNPQLLLLGKLPNYPRGRRYATIDVLVNGTNQQGPLLVLVREKPFGQPSRHQEMTNEKDDIHGA